MFAGKMLGVDEAMADVGRIVALSDVLGFAAARDATRQIAQGMTAKAIDGPPGPNVDTGRLSGSITADGPHRVGFGHYKAEIGPSGVEYARIIELGSNARGHRKHPYVRPGLKAERREAARIWGRAITRVTRGG